MREAGELHKRLGGSDKAKAAGYINVARTLLGRMKAYLGAGVSGSKQWVLRDGTKIVTSVMGTIERVSIVTAGLCNPLAEMFLSGFVCRPAYQEAYVGLNDGETDPDLASPNPNVLITPELDPDTDQPSDKVPVWFYSGPYVPEEPLSGFPEEVNIGKYGTRVLDTCGKVGKWMEDFSVGNIDWQSRDGLLKLSWRTPGGRYGVFNQDTRFDNAGWPLGGFTGHGNLIWIPGRQIDAGSSSSFPNYRRVTSILRQPDADGLNSFSDFFSGTYLSFETVTTGLFFRGRSIIGVGIDTVTGAAIKRYTDDEGTELYKLLVVGIKPLTSTDPNGRTAKESVKLYDFNPKKSEATNSVELAVSDDEFAFFSLSGASLPFVLPYASYLFNDSCTQARTHRYVPPADPGDEAVWPVTLNVIWGANGSATAEFVRGAEEEIYIEDPENVSNREFLFYDFDGDTLLTGSVKTEQVGDPPQSEITFKRNGVAFAGPSINPLLTYEQSLSFCDLRFELYHIIEYGPTDTNLIVMHHGQQVTTKLVQSGLGRPAGIFRQPYWAAGLWFANGDGDAALSSAPVHDLDSPDAVAAVLTVRGDGVISQYDPAILMGLDSFTNVRFNPIGVF